MTPQEVLSAAKQGNPQAIAALMNHSLKLQGITAKAKLNDGCLQVMLEGGTVPNQAEIVPYVTNGIKRLGVTTVKSLSIYGQVTGDVLPTWREHVGLTELLSITQVKATKKGFGSRATLNRLLLIPVNRNQKIAAGLAAITLLIIGSILYQKHQCNRAIEQQAIAQDGMIQGTATLNDLIQVATYRKKVCGN